MDLIVLFMADMLPPEKVDLGRMVDKPPGLGGGAVKQDLRGWNGTPASPTTAEFDPA